jgi:hypothetical protein
MRPWIIILTSVICAIVVATAMVGPELLATPYSDLRSIVLPHLPGLVVATLAVYALCAMLLATGTLAAAILSVRRRLERMGGYQTPAQPNWTAAFGSTGLHRLVPWPVAESGRRTGATEKILLQGRFSPAAARGEVSRLHYIWLARSHFFSALIVISALVGLGLAQDHGSVPLPMSAIPTVSAILILVGLILLAILGRIALDVSAEPLIEAISLLAAVSLEVALLRRILELIETACTTAAANVGAPVSTLQIPDRLEVVIEEGQRGLIDAARHLSMTTDALRAALGSSIDALNTAISTATAQLPPIAAYSNQASRSSELEGAMEALTAVLRRLTTAPDIIEGPTILGADQSARRQVQEPHLAGELRRLLQEMEAAC